MDKNEIDCLFTRFKKCVENGPLGTNGWGDIDYSIAFTPSQVDSIAKFVLDIFSSFEKTGKIFPSFNIGPMEDASIDLYWKEEEGALLINITRDFVASYYGYIKNYDTGKKLKEIEDEIDSIESITSKNAVMEELVQLLSEFA